jgi:hypothetical protein
MVSGAAPQRQHGLSDVQHSLSAIAGLLLSNPHPTVQAGAGKFASKNKAKSKKPNIDRLTSTFFMEMSFQFPSP